MNKNIGRLNTFLINSVIAAAVIGFIVGKAIKKGPKQLHISIPDEIDEILKEIEANAHVG